MTTPTQDGGTDKSAARMITVIVDFTDEEEAILLSRAAEMGLTPEDYMRTRLGLLPLRDLLR